MNVDKKYTILSAMYVYMICIYMCDICMLSLIWMLIHVSYVCLDFLIECWFFFSSWWCRERFIQRYVAT